MCEMLPKPLGGAVPSTAVSLVSVVRRASRPLETSAGTSLSLAFGEEEEEEGEKDVAASK